MTSVHIDGAQLRLLELPLRFRFETSFGVQTRRTILLLTLRSGGVEGYGESVMELLPAYREEVVPGAEYLIRELLLPSVLGRSFAGPAELGEVLAGFRGNRMAKAVVEMAFHDLYARTLGVPLRDLLGGTRASVPVGVSLGIQESVDATVDLVARHVEQGYARIKLKIKPGWDVRPVAAVRAAFPDLTMTVDANSAYRLSDSRVFAALDELGLDYIEQPLAYDDLHDHALLQGRLSTPLCLDESILSAQDARKALASDAGRVINVKPARVGGHSESVRVHAVAQAFGAPLWMGGMLEAGVGRAHNIHLATLPGFTKPGDVSSASRYWEEDIVNEPLEAEGGRMPVPAGAGIGVTLNEDVLSRVTLRSDEFLPT
ncbi:o-succinylbenzoate synthase [Deinococcus pimensis]|uniref:o-succinylbenzoate synthase n=1 Tax=Deinococcus pimensis TaxID=309888 RepID=UPI000487F247|nr:o-succinylbenzoate synthase [Deinococcus pimensis]